MKVLENINKFLSKFWLWLFLLGLVSLITLQPEQMSLQRVTNAAEDRIKQDDVDFLQLTNDSFLLQKIYSGNVSLAELQAIRKQDLRFYFYRDDSLIFWTENKSLLLYPPSLIKQKISVQQLQNGWYLAYKRDFPDLNRTVVALRLIQHTFSTPSKFLNNDLDLGLHIPGNFQFAVVPQKSKPFVAVNDTDSNILFYLSNVSEHNAYIDSYTLLYLIFVVFLLLIYFTNKLSIALQAKAGFLSSLIFLIAFSAALFLLLSFLRRVYLPSSLPVFSPVFCASSWLIFSLSDLFVFCFLPLWWLLYINRFSHLVYPIAQPKWKRHFHQLLLVLSVYPFSLVIVLVAKTLIIDSSISFQIFNLLSLSVYSFIGLLSLGLLVFAHYLFSYRVIRLIYGISLSTRSFLFSGLGIATVLSVLLYFSSYAEVGIAAIWWTTAWLFILLWIYEDRFTLLRARNLVAITVLYAILITYLVENLYEQRERSLRVLAANILMQERDFLAESNFEQTAARITKDYSYGLINDTFVADANTRERWNTKYFSKYLSKYDVTFALLHRKEIYDAHFLAYLEQRLDKANYNYTQLRLCPDSTGNYTYLSLLELDESSLLYIELVPRIYASGNIYSELIADNALANRVNEEGFSYAIYRNNRLVAQRGEYAYSYFWNSNFVAEGDKAMFIDVEDWEHNIHEAANNKRVIVSVKQESPFEPIATFSYLFTFFFMLGGGGLMVINLQKKYSHRENVLNGFYTSFRTRINYAMLVIILTSFIIIGFITVSFFRQQYDIFYSGKLVDKEKAVMAALELTTEYNQSIPVVSLAMIGNEIKKLSVINGVDINLFDLKGNLVATSQPPLFDRGIISRKMNPAAYLSLSDNSQTQLSQLEAIGKLTYHASYFPLRNIAGKTIGFVSIPYFERNQSIDNEVSAFLIALMNVYVFLLICAAALAYFISNSVTRPLSFIAEKLQLVNLSRKNEPIAWNSRDEIGILVKQYNRMIRELENSAEQLAKTEREGAWREMAKQIAHEIKNPLTPMKLSIQYLQKAIQEQNPNVNVLAEKMSKTLIEQIDNLSAIATSFSSFAKMPKGENEVVDLNDMLSGITDLFSREQQAEIVFKTSLEIATVFADRNQLLSVFNNLVKNGIQSVSSDTIPQIVVNVDEEHDMIKVAFSDNGVGIAEENYSKVFAPNFTTKSSGMGLGLAISLQIIEAAGGAIWFESVVGSGTTFFVVLPKHQNN